VSWRTSAPFILCHFLPLIGLFTGFALVDLVLVVVLFEVRMFFITAGYHRYFAHKSFQMNRAMQFVFAFGGLTAAQKGPLWWAAHHRTHHRYTDTDRDPHTPLRGFWWSHIGWILSGEYGATNYEVIEDFARYPELRFLNRHDWIGPWSLAVASFLIGGWSGLFVGFFGSTVLLWHATFTVNSFAHVFGRRRYETDDLSRNSLGVALLTGGEGWHNNHHHYPKSARQGFYWWEIDVTYGVLRLLAWLGLVHDLRQPTAAALDARRVTMKV
jgi:stearoyl-CoA desaturase (delta-9 desaturase)